MSQCIPILYYGTEQGFNGGNDPNNRESLWPYMTQTHELYTFIKYLLQIRKNLTVNNWLKTPQIERQASSKVYSFSRGEILIVITTEINTTYTKIKSHPYKSGQMLKNLLNATQTFKVSSKGKLEVTLTDGEPLVLATVKINSRGLAVSSHLYFSTFFTSLIIMSLGHL